MTYEEAIKITRKNADICDLELQDEWESVVIEALEKQIPKKPLDT